MMKTIKIISYYQICVILFFYILSNMRCLTIFEIPNCDVNMIMRQLHRHENLRFSRLISS